MPRLRRLLASLLGAGFVIQANAGVAAGWPGAARGMIDRFCLDCHDAAARKGGLDLDGILNEPPANHPAAWERVIRKLQARHMPPPGQDRPGEREYDAVVSWLSGSLDRAAARKPDPGRADTLRRLNRTEYQNAIRDLLALEIDAAALLPKDDASHGFDNVGVGDLSPTLLHRYIAAAEKISRLALGSAERQPGGATYRTPPDLTQEEHLEGLPPGTRGGLLVHHTFPRDGEYEIQIRLTRDRNEEVEGLRREHEVEVLLDRARVGLFTVAPPGADRNFETVDAHLKMRLPVQAGRRAVGVTFLRDSSPFIETRRQPYSARFNYHRHPRQAPAIYQVSINGPFLTTGPGDSPSRRRVFVSYPGSPAEEDACAATILSVLQRRAYRRPPSREETDKLLGYYREVRAGSGFEAGIEAALSSILFSPGFLFRVERDPPGLAPGSVHRLDDFALASRLSFFLWSSIPDEELLDLAGRGQLRRPRVWERQVRRLLADERGLSLANDFAAQWLHLRNLESFTPDLRLFPDFDDNLRQALRRETEMHFAAMVREDGSVLKLLRSDHTFVNERLAKHYGLEGIYGSRFRRVELRPDSQRGGLLRQGSVLTVTSYATRTSPVLRGNWILGNLLGTPPPPPPPDVPALEENAVSESAPIRERLAAHRANPACASCHNLMDPAGFALENFDAIGRWRESENGLPINAAGGLPGGASFEGVAGLEAGLLERPELFVTALTEKLLTYALGRGLGHHDMPAIRKIVREARSNNYRFSSLILGIAQSTPFQWRKTAPEE